MDADAPTRTEELRVSGLRPGETRAGWLLLLAVAGLALASRFWNAFVYPPLHDFDGPGHALNVLAFYEGQLPDPRSWVGFHAPLYHLSVAGLWQALPDAWSVPVHSLARGLSALAGAAACGVAGVCIARYIPRFDAALVAVFAFCVPGVAVATSMLGNETFCALFATWALARTVGVEGPASLADAAATGALAGLAALSKSTGLVVVGIIGLSLLWRGRRVPRKALAAAATAGLVAAVLAAPHYVHLFSSSGGDPLAVISGAALSPELAAEMASQPPGERHFSDYLAFPWPALIAPVHFAPGMERSVPGLLYASLWADAHSQFLPGAVPSVLRAEALLCLLGLLPSLLALIGWAVLLRDEGLRRAFGPALFFFGLLALSWLRYTWIWPTFAAVKASYLLPALLPASAALGVGLTELPERWRSRAHFGLIGLALLAVAVTTWGWWE